MVARNDWLRANPRTAERLLRALHQAEEWTVRNQREARVVLTERLGLDETGIEEIWPENQFALTLDYSLILAMEDQARWMLSRDLSTATALPDLSRFVQADAMLAVKPDAVNVTR
jgi:ABC-type nitrate/sulfonate/bicarbonate transport system substrate-binding protein